MDSYRLELENLSDAIRGEAELLLGREDALGTGEGARGAAPLCDERRAGLAVTAGACFQYFPRALAWGGRMSAHAVPAPTGPTFTIRGRPYPVLLPKLSDPRLHLAAVIISLQIIGQVGFHFDLSIAQILLAIGTCAVLEVAIAMRSAARHPVAGERNADRQRRRVRPARARHGARRLVEPASGWWIYVGTAAVVAALEARDPVARRAHLQPVEHRSRPLLPPARPHPRAPLDFWWGPMSAWLVLALAIIVAGGFLILWRLKLLRVAIGFWITFAVAIGVLALSGTR